MVRASTNVLIMFTLRSKSLNRKRRRVGSLAGLLQQTAASRLDPSLELGLKRRPLPSWRNGFEDLNDDRARIAHELAARPEQPRVECERHTGDSQALVQ